VGAARATASIPSSSSDDDDDVSIAFS